MPYSYRVVESEGVLHIQVSGGADVAELLALARALEADPRVRPEMPALVDAREYRCRLSSTDLRQLVEIHLTSRGGAARPAAVLFSGAADYGVGRMLSAFSELRGIELYVTTAADDASAWVRARVRGPAYGKEA